MILRSPEIGCGAGAVLLCSPHGELVDTQLGFKQEVGNRLGRLRGKLPSPHYRHLVQMLVAILNKQAF